jgi:hypothetical protein
MSPLQMSITLNSSESDALRRSALRDLRRPKDQARYLLRLALGLVGDTAQSQPMDNRAEAVSQAVPSAIAD